ncbi:MAG: hypothetical protein JRJ02_11565 [Deltaproteobacteria bacterium]|nr:hypothetical protein [Deltaproteobacteria bacterium]
MVAGDYVYMGSWNDGLRIMDVSDPSNPFVAGLCEDICVKNGLALSGNYAYCLGGTNTQKLYIVDISSPHSPYQVADIDLTCIDPPCSGFQYMNVAVRAPYAYVSGTKWTANGSRAILAVVDISDHSSLQMIGMFVCFYESDSWGTIGLSGDYVYLPLNDLSHLENDRRSGFMAVDISDPTNPYAEYWDYSTISGSYSRDVVVRGNNAYLTGDVFNVYDISNPARPKFIAYFPVRCASLALSGDYAYLAWDKLMILNISNPYNPYGVIGYEGEWAEGVAVSGNRVYMPGSLYILKNRSAPDLSISSPSALSTLVGSVPVEAKASHSTGIDEVEFYIDGSLKTTNRLSPFIYTWDTTSEEDGLHKIKVKAYNNNGMSSEAEIEVFTRSVYKPLNFSGEKIMNRSLSQAEHINVLSWQANPGNVNIAKYRIFLKNGYSRSLLAELNSDIFEYMHRKVEEETPYTYVLVAVDHEGRESDPVSVSIQ